FTLPKVAKPEKINPEEDSDERIEIKTPEILEILEKITPPKIRVHPNEEDLDTVVNCLRDMGYVVEIKDPHPTTKIIPADDLAVEIEKKAQLEAPFEDTEKKKPKKEKGDQRE
ncbi:MAG: hypothetical protein D6785_15710, partial [Planctomycetota bacterium]